MQHQIKVDDTRKITSILRYIYIVLLVCAFALWISVGILLARHQPENVAIVNSELQSVEYDKEEDRYLFKLKDFEHTLKISNSFDNVPNLCDTLFIGESVTVSYYASTIDMDAAIAISIATQNGVVVDLQEDYTKNHTSVTIVAVVLTVVAIAGVVASIIISKKGHHKTYDYFEYTSKTLAWQVICCDELDFDARQKKRLKAVLIFGILFVFTLVAFALSAEKYPEYPHILIPILVVLCALETLLLFKMVGYKIYKQQDVKLFVDKYMQYLSTQDMAHEYNSNFQKDKFIKIDNCDDFFGYIYYDTDSGFLDNGKYISSFDQIDHTEYSYEEMGLYAYCYFEKKFHSAHIYICSEKLFGGYPLVLSLSPLAYQDIQKNGVHIKGLDYLLSHLEEEIINNNKQGIKYKSYKDFD